MEIENTGVKNNVSESPSETPTADTTIADTSSDNSNQAPQTSGVNTGVGKTYTEEEVNKILHERTKAYSEKIKKLEEQLSSLSSSVKTQEKPLDTELTPEEKAFLDFFKNKIMKHLEIPSLSKEQIEFINYLAEKEKIARENFLKYGEEYLKQSIKEMGLNNEDALVAVKEMVAALILNDETLRQKFVNGDKDVFKDAFEMFKKTFSDAIKHQTQQEVKKIVQTKSATANVRQPIKDGINAAITEKKPLSDEEFLEMAFRRLKEGG